MDDSATGRKRKPLSQLTLSNDIAVIAGKKKKNSDVEKRAGTITRMILKNFMCHSFLDVDLSVNINIIIGRNGSGKSAILTGLIVGLGGKASLTNRGNSVKGFIKAGKNSASVEIQLYNGGPMAYKPRVYGDKITIIRNMTSGGSGGYKIKNDRGEVVATQVREIHNITASLNIQIDNPVCILNQDISRNFLSSNNPKHKFQLFMKATKLETLEEEHKKVLISKRDSVRLFEDKQKSFKKAQEEMRALKRKIDSHRSIVGMKDKIKMMQVELLWAKVRDAEEEVRKEQSAVNNWEQKSKNLEADIENRAGRIQSIQDNIETLNQQISELKEANQGQSRNQMDLKNVVDQLKARYTDKRREKQLLGNTIESKTADANYLRGEIKIANEKMSRVEQEKMQRLRDLTSMNEKIKGMEDHLQTCRNDLYQITSDVSRKEEEKQALRRDISHLDSQINNEKSTLNALKNESGNSLLFYGQDIPKIKQLIEQNKHKFKHVPRGPLGSYIKLKDKKWGIAVESFLGPPLLGSFTVDNGKDNQLLMQIFNQAWTRGRKPTVITSKFFFEKHNVKPNLVQAPKDCLCLYNALEIEDIVVSNCIVDQAGVENILLIPDNERAMELLSAAANVPRNCRQGVTMKGDKYYPDPNYKTYGSTYHRAQYLQVDTKEHIIQLEQNIRELLQKKQNLESQYATFCNEMREQEQKKTQLEEKIRKINAARSQVRRQLEELKASAEPEVASVELLETELTEVENTVKQKKTEILKLDEELKQIKSEIEQFESKLKKLKDSSSSLEERMSYLENQIREETTRQREIATSDEFDKRKAKELHNKVNNARAQLVAKQSTVTQYTEQASTLGERQETRRKVPDLIEEIHQLERSVKKIETHAENSEELLIKYQDMCEKFDKVATVLDYLNSDVMQLTLALEKRKKHYKLTENYFVTFIKHSFKKIMEVRQFQGSIDINMQDQKLDLVVVPQRGSQGVTTTANLSGGERSFSTVAFLYSLWQCMEFPFYFLDEFDVYMDKLNRTKVIEILLHHAETHPELQFVFLTPQDVSFVKKNVAILRLQDPERFAA